MTTHLSTEPVIVERGEQPYLALRQTVTMTTIPEIADRFPELFGWLGERGIEVIDAPFLKYNVFHSSGRLEMEAGVPVRDRIPGDDRIVAGVLPGGRFASVTHHGHPSGLLEVTANLLDWGAKQGLRWDMSASDEAETWGMRIELYKTNPALEPDPNRWETELVFRLAD
jgi:effector-binding domain-containing protein